MKLFLLSKENIALAKAEVEALLGEGKLTENLLLVNTKKDTDRLAYTRMVCDVLFECDKEDIEKKIKKYPWDKVVKDSFALIFLISNKKSQRLSKKYGGMIYDLLKKPKVDLENPKTKIVAMQNKDKIYFGIQEWENKEDFNERKTQNRPEQQPISLDPKLARACVNLTGSTKSIYDPFCGTGGFLIEAGLMKLNVIGSDVDEFMIEYSKKNLKHYKIKKFTLSQKDATKISRKYDHIVTDLPYGRSTKITSKDLYSRFILRLPKMMKKRAVIIFPNYFNTKRLLNKSKLKIKGHYSVYVHKSLTRDIYVLEN